MATQAVNDRSSLSVELVINGQKVSAAPGSTILDVVRNQKIDEIPTLCYDPKLEPYGSCFLCVVEVKGSQRLVPACVTKIRDGMEVTTRNERIVTARKTALELLLSDHYADCVCPGQRACPAGVDIQGYLSLARLGYYQESLDLMRERNPLPLICGRVCVRKCEVKCLRQNVDDPVGINLVKRFVSEQVRTAPAKPKDVLPSGKRVAVIGGGPGGLSCANYLALMGHDVTIFESLPKLGGMLRYGIPEYRLPRTELDAEIQGILDLGIKVELNKTLGKDFTASSLIEKDKYDAVFVALGAPLGKKLGVKGEEAIEGIRTALDFLRDTELYDKPVLKGKVIVVGGGNSAIDAARTAIRCGAEEVTILYRRTRKEMPAHHEEVDAAEKEGVKLELLVAPLDLIAENGKLKAIRCQRMELGEPDASGRRKPVPIKGAIVDFPCDYIFGAIGQDTDLTPLQEEPEEKRLKTSRWSTIEADPATMVTNIKGVFAGGDVVLGPAAVIDAVAHGRFAAEAIDRYLKTGEVTKPRPDFKSSRDFFGPMPEWTFENVEPMERSHQPEREAAERIHDFCQVEMGLDEPHMKTEAFRCMECGCKSVFSCDLKRYAAEYNVDIARVSGEVRRHRMDHSHPLISLDPNKCILCGRCVRTCADIVGLSVLGFVGRGFATTVRPTLGQPMADSACIACGACVESCPTGAIEARLPYNRQGPWHTHKVASVCNFCSVGCELDLNVVSDGLFWATATQHQIPGHVNELCLKGRFGTGLIHGPDRLSKPMVKKDGKLVEAGWDEAIQAAADLLRGKVKEFGPESVAVMAAARMTLEEAALLRHIGKEALGTEAIGSFGQNRRGGPRHDLDEILGETASTCTIDDVDKADLIILAGADPSITHPVLGMAIRRALKRGAEIVAVNSSQVDLLRPGDLWLDARRGTAGLIFTSVLAEMVKSGASQDQGWQAGGLGNLKASLAATSLPLNASLAGVEAAEILSLAEKIGRAQKVIAVYDLDETLERATDDLKALAQILMVSGHIAPAQGLLLLQSDCNGEGARLAGIRNPLHLEPIRAALVMLENPLGDHRAARELAGIKSLVVIDHFLTETARAADVVLPAATLAESDGSVITLAGKIKGVHRASRPKSGISNLELLARLAQALGKPVASADPVQIRAELAKSLGISAPDLEKARSEGSSLPRRPVGTRSLKVLCLDSTASVANIYPYASLDGILEKKLSGLGKL